MGNTIAAVFALGAATLYGVGNALEHRVVADTGDAGPARGGLFARLIRSPLWILGMFGDVGAYGLQAAALAFGTLVVIQALVEALRGWTLRVFGHLLSFQIVGNLIRHMLRLPAEFFEKRHVGDVLSRIGAVQPIQEAIVAAINDGDFSAFERLLSVVSAPYDDHPAFRRYADPPRPDQVVRETFCGT